MQISPWQIPSKVASDGGVRENTDERHSVYQSLKQKPTTVMSRGWQRWLAPVTIWGPLRKRSKQAKPLTDCCPPCWWKAPGPQLLPLELGCGCHAHVRSSNGCSTAQVPCLEFSFVSVSANTATLKQVYTHTPNGTGCCAPGCASVQYLKGLILRVEGLPQSKHFPDISGNNLKVSLGFTLNSL